MEVRAMRAGEGQRLRELRLRALRASPEAFSSWPEREEAFAPEVWEDRGQAVFVAESDGEWLGMVGTFVDPDLPAICNVWGTWVDPRARGRGAGRALMDAAVESARAAGLRRVELGVSDRAPAAAALYERLGFRRTGVTHAIEKVPGVTEERLALALPPPFPIETERLRLRFTTPDDFEALLALQSREDVTRLLYWGPRNEDEVRKSLALKLAATRIDADGDALTLAIEPKDGGGYAGDVVLWSTSQQHRQGELGYILHPEHHGRGYATEATRPLLELGFTVYGMRRIVGRVEPRNAASARVLEKLGMRREAHFVENELVKGEWQSELVFAQLEAEWRASRASRGA